MDKPTRKEDLLPPFTAIGEGDWAEGICKRLRDYGVPLPEPMGDGAISAGLGPASLPQATFQLGYDAAGTDLEDLGICRGHAEVFGWTPAGSFQMDAAYSATVTPAMLRSACVPSRVARSVSAGTSPRKVLRIKRPISPTRQAREPINPEAYMPSTPGAAPGSASDALPQHSGGSSHTATN